MTELLWTNHFRDQLRQLETANLQAARGLAGAIRYLAEFGRSAVAPDVKWYIATSRFAGDAGEIRWPDPERQDEYPDQAWRGLYVAATDMSWILFTVLGNKASSSTWYDDAVPESDLAFTSYCAARAEAGNPLAHVPTV